MTTLLSRKTAALGIAFAVGSVTGCSASAPPASAPTTTTGAAHTHNPSDHNHARGKMLMASDGHVDAMLTAHLSSKDGNELDIYVEEGGKPKALAVTTLAAVARAGSAPDAEKKTLSFACAPDDERPKGEAAGTCSHFVAKAPWLRPGEPVRVDSALPADGKEIAMTWRDFEARRYAHHEE